MNSLQENKIKLLIHSHAAAAAVGNVVPIPGVGFAADMATMTTLAMLIAAELGGNIPESVQRNLVVAALKRQVMKQPMKYIVKKAVKYAPVVGPALSAGFSVAMLEAAGWSLAKSIDQQCGGNGNSTAA